MIGRGIQVMTEGQRGKSKTGIASSVVWSRQSPVYLGGEPYPDSSWDDLGLD